MFCIWVSVISKVRKNLKVIVNVSYEAKVKENWKSWKNNYVWRNEMWFSTVKIIFKRRIRIIRSEYETLRSACVCSKTNLAFLLYRAKPDRMYIVVDLRNLGNSKRSLLLLQWVYLNKTKKFLYCFWVKCIGSQYPFMCSSFAPSSHSFIFTSFDICSNGK